MISLWLWLCLFYVIIKPRWRTPQWHLKHWQLEISAHIRPTFPATSQSSQTLTPTSKHLWVRIAFHFHIRKKTLKGWSFPFYPFPFCSFTLNMTLNGVFPDVQRTCVWLSSFEGEGSKSEKRCRASSHPIHGKDGRNSEPLQRWHHHLPTWVRLYGNICINVCT